MPLLSGFVSMFGVGGLFGTEGFGTGAAMASWSAVFGVVGAGLVWAMFGALRRAKAPTEFSLPDLVGQRGRVTVASAGPGGACC